MMKFILLFLLVSFTLASAQVHTGFTVVPNLPQGLIITDNSLTGELLVDTTNHYGVGSVLSVGLSLPAIFSVSGTPVTTTGTLSATLASQSANLIFASPNGSSGTPSFRSLVSNDIPSLTAFYEVPLTFSTGLTRTTNTITVNTSQNIAKLSNLVSNGFVKTSGGDGTLGIDGSTYLTGNQTITLSGDVSGSGATAITTTIGANKVTNAMLSGSIAASKLVGTDITTVGTITSGIWHGTTIDNAYLTNGAVANLSGTNTGDQTITLTSDVTGSGTGSFAATIAANAVTTSKINNSAVTLAKMADIATGTLIGRNTAGTGAPEALTSIPTAITASSLTSFGTSPTIVTPSITTGFTISGTAATGTILRGDGTNFVATTNTFPNTANAGDILTATGSNVIGVVGATATARKVLLSQANATSIWSTETYAAPGANVGSALVGDGTNWISNQSGWMLTKVSGSDFTTTSTSLVDITGLGFSAVASTNYEIEVYLYLNSSSSPGVNLGINSTGTSPVVVWSGTATNGANTGISMAVNSNNATTGLSVVAVNGDGFAHINGIIHSGTGTPTISVRIDKQTSGTAKVYIGSKLLYRVQ